MNVAVIGAGPTGLGLAYELTKNGINVDVYERDTIPGGLAKSITLWGQQVEVGPHYLTEDLVEGVKDMMASVIDYDDLHKYERKTRIYIDGKFFIYPPGAMNLIKNLGPVKTMQVGFSYLAQIVSPAKDDGTVESFITKNLGSYLYKNFFKEYSEKLWGTPCNTIDESYGKIMIGFGQLSRLQTIKKYFTKKNIQQFSKNLYPKGGMNILWNKLTEKVREQGGTVNFGASITQLIVEGKKVKGLQFADGTVKPYTYVISTVPESIVLKMLPDVPKKLTDDLATIKFRSVICVFFLVEHCNLIDSNSVFIYTNKVKAARITNYNAFRNEEGNDIFSIEYWTGDNDELWSLTPEQITELVKEDLKQFNGHEKIKIKETKVIKLRNAYQVPFPDLKFIKADAANYLKSFDGLLITGRANQTNFNYGMGDALTEGYNKALEIMEKEPVTV